MSSISFARRASKIKYCTAQLSELVCEARTGLWTLDSGLWTPDFFSRFLNEKKKRENSIVFKKGK